MSMQPDDSLAKHLQLKPAQEQALKKRGITLIRDLLFHFPHRYGDVARVTTIDSLQPGENAQIYGTVKKLETKKSYRGKVPMAEGTIEDTTGTAKAVWFHQPYIAKMIKEGAKVRVEGEVSERNKKPGFVNPEIETVTRIPIGVGDSLFSEDIELYAQPVYPESKGVSSRWFFHAIQKVIRAGVLDSLTDPIPEEIRTRYNLPELKTALIWIHTPKKKAHADSARKRFSFEEIFFIQLQKQLARREYEKHPSFVITKTWDDLEAFTKQFPFDPTGAQERAIKQVLDDFQKPHAMSRLLEGDVGSGKTFVAAVTAKAVIDTRPDPDKDFGNLQVGYMAPTEVLARQHFASFKEFFAQSGLPAQAGIQLGLITSSGCEKFPSKTNPSESTTISRRKLLEWVKNGEIPILIGTHSLIQDSVEFENLAYVIVDEQHRFGVSQRQALTRRQTADTTQTDADKTKTEHDSENQLLFQDLTYKLRGAVFAVRKKLGNGHKESVYQNALAEEFKKQKIEFEQEKRIDIYYGEKKVGTYQPDFLVDNKMLIELKALNFIGHNEKKQVWNYLRGTPHQLALLVNFGPDGAEIERIIDQDKNEGLRQSASSPQQSAQQVLPHLLSMTATPIPRTLALTMYGDLDLTLLDEMPKERKQIKTAIVPPTKRKNVYAKIAQELEAGRQLYVICPRIDEPDPEKEQAILAKSVNAEAKRLKKENFPDYQIEIMHSKMTPKEKSETMNRFESGETDILVSTSVVEVGVNVPNATMIIIEGAERFGLAQLHQLRGRVMRGSYQPYCFVFTESGSKKTQERLEALKKAKNGFELAEYDLAQRGAGELAGGRQSGISDLGMEAIKNIKMVEAARTEATNLIEEDATLASHPILQKHLETRNLDIHFE